MSHVSVHRYFAACSPGLEELLRSELDELGIQGESTPGGVMLRGPLSVLWQTALGSRLAESVRLRLKPFVATNFSALETGLAKLPWHAYFAARSPIDIRVSCASSKLYHTTAVEERLRRVLEGLGRAEQCYADETNSTSKAKQHHNEGHSASDDEARSDAGPDRSEAAHSTRIIHVRIHRNEVLVSVDATGERLHRRGYRTHVGKAPIRETLAAAAVRLLQRGAPRPLERVWDPCCGSGTMLAEWLQTRSKIWPAFASKRERTYAFERWPIHPREEFAQWTTSARREHGHDLTSTFSAFGSDQDARTLDAARHNLGNAGVLAGCTLIERDFRKAHTDVPEGTAVLSNLPYGVRLKGGNPGRNQAFDALDALLGTRRDLRPAVVISTERPPSSLRNWQPAVHFSNGGLAVTAWILV